MNEHEEALTAGEIHWGDGNYSPREGVEAIVHAYLEKRAENWGGRGDAAKRLLAEFKEANDE